MRTPHRFAMGSWWSQTHGSREWVRSNLLWDMQRHWRNMRAGRKASAFVTKIYTKQAVSEISVRTHALYTTETSRHVPSQVANAVVMSGMSIGIATRREEIWRSITSFSTVMRATNKLIMEFHRSIHWSGWKRTYHRRCVAVVVHMLPRTLVAIVVASLVAPVSSHVVIVVTAVIMVSRMLHAIVMLVVLMLMLLLLMVVVL